MRLQLPTCRAVVSCKGRNVGARKGPNKEYCTIVVLMSDITGTRHQGVFIEDGKFFFFGFFFTCLYIYSITGSEKLICKRLGRFHE
jgi:hypothetical protein